MTTDAATKPPVTPQLADEQAKLDPLSSRYVNVEALAWEPTPAEGIDMKVLMKDDRGRMTALSWKPISSMTQAEAL